MPLTATKGAWSPQATVAYQWVVGGVGVAGATEKTFTPRPRTSASRSPSRCWPPAPATSTAIVPGDADGRDAARRHPHDEGAGRAAVTRWSAAPSTHHRHVVDHGGHLRLPVVRRHHGDRRAPRTRRTSRRAAEAGQQIHVVVTALRAGLHLGHARVGGHRPGRARPVAFAKPTIRGQAVVGRTLTAHARVVQPTDGRRRTTAGTAATTRSAAPTRRRTSCSAADLGHRIHVVVTMRAPQLGPADQALGGDRDVRTAPRLHVRTSIRTRPRVPAAARERSRPDRTPTARPASGWDGQSVGRFDGGRRSRQPAAAPRCGTGAHTLTVVYRGGARETVGRTTVHRHGPLTLALRAPRTSSRRPAAGRSA